MEYAKEETLNTNYRDEKGIVKRRTSSLLRTIQKHKFIQLIIGIAIILCTVNIIFICNFFSLLSKI